MSNDKWWVSEFLSLTHLWVSEKIKKNLEHCYVVNDTLEKFYLNKKERNSENLMNNNEYKKMQF